MNKVHAGIIEVMRNVGAIAKDQKNEAQRFNFRGIEDIYNRLQPLMAKAGIYSVPSVLDFEHQEGETSRGGRMFHLWARVKYTIYADDGSNVEVVTIGESMDSGDKGGNKAMAAAHKYALSQLFCIPYEDMDPDAHAPDWAKTASGRITEKQFLELKKRWFSSVKSELEGVDKEQVAEKFDEWVSGVLEFTETLQYRTWRDLGLSELQRCEAALDQSASDALTAAGLEE